MSCLRVVVNRSLLFSLAPLAASVSGGLASAQTDATSQNQPLEEVFVTGSFIARSQGFTSASPVDTFDRSSFDAHAPKTVADFLAQLPYSYNTQFMVGRAIGSSNGSGTLNLRNLGAGATLVLLNSRRTARNAVTLDAVDVNSLVPQIAIDRVEILKDGASSLYGSDAVGGVANFITRSDFEGAEFNMQGELREASSTTDYRVSGIWGYQGDRLSLILAGEHFTREPYNIETLKVWRDNDVGFYLPGWPARFSVPNRDANGRLADLPTVLADPQCAEFSRTIASGEVVRHGETFPANCQQDIPWATRANGAESRYQLYGETRYDFSEKISLFGEFSYLRTRTHLSDTPGAAVRPATGTPDVIIPGYAPSNPFRAVNADGQPLYALNSGKQLPFDKDGDGINDFLPARDPVTGEVIVVGTDPNAVGENSLPVVPFWEDVSIFPGSRQIGRNCNLPGDPKMLDNCRNSPGHTTDYHVDVLRFVVGLDGELRNDWRYQVSYTFAKNDEDGSTFGSAFSMPALRAALAGYGGDGCITTSLDPLRTNALPGSGPCQFFNVFGSSVTTTEGTLLANTPEIISFITARDWQKFSSSIKNLDVVISGSPVHLPAGPIGVAFGLQSRVERWSADYPTLMNAGQTDLQAPFYDKDVSQTVRAMFGEINIPLVERESFGYLEFAGALRYEDTSGPGLSTTDPKIGLLYTNPSGRIALRGTWSTSFLAPTLYERYRQNSQWTNQVDDWLTSGNDNISRVTTQVQGNPALDPQSSEAFNVGITFEPVQHLVFDIDHWSFEFKDQIALESAFEIAMDPERTLDPTWVIRDPSAGTVVDDKPGSPTFGQTFGRIVQINTSYVNRGAVKTSGFDFGIRHDWDVGKWGHLQNSLQATWQTDYKVRATHDSPWFDVSGSRNARVTGASFAVDWRATLRTLWIKDRHSVQSLVRFTDSFANDQAPNPGMPAKPKVESYTTWDLSYSYAFDLDSRYLRSGSIGVGVTNVFDSAAPMVPDGNHLLATMYDYGGRRWWARLRMSF